MARGGGLTIPVSDLGRAITEGVRDALRTQGILIDFSEEDDR